MSSNACRVEEPVRPRDRFCQLFILFCFSPAYTNSISIIRMVIWTIYWPIHGHAHFLSVLIKIAADGNGTVRRYNGAESSLDDRVQCHWKRKSNVNTTIFGFQRSFIDTNDYFVSIETEFGGLRYTDTARLKYSAMVYVPIWWYSAMCMCRLLFVWIDLCMRKNVWFCFCFFLFFLVSTYLILSLETQINQGATTRNNWFPATPPIIRNYFAPNWPRATFLRTDFYQNDRVHCSMKIGYFWRLLWECCPPLGIYGFVKP